MTVRISIVTPVLNGATTVRTAVESVLAQADQDFEHVVVDGGSNDGTVSVLREFPHLKVVTDPGSGQVEAMNRGFGVSTGAVLSYLNADDSFEPGAFAEVRRRFQEDAGLRFMVGRLRVVEGGKPERISDPNVEFERMLRFFDRDFFPLNPACCFWRRAVQETIGGFDPAHPYAMDYKFMLEVALHFPIARTEAVLGCYRIHPGSKTGSTSSDRQSWEKVRFSRNYWRHLSRGARLRAWVWYWTEGHYLPRRLVGRFFGKLRSVLRY